MSYTTENLDKALFKVIQDYYGDIGRDIRKVVKSVSLEAKQRLRETSPKSGRSQKKEYAKGWKIRTKDTGSAIEATVYNSTKPGLAHILEHGRKAGEKNGYHYPAASAKPHIKAVEEWAEEEVVQRLSEMWE